MINEERVRPVWECHAWLLLTPCTDGWKCTKCGTLSPLAFTSEPCTAPAVSGPPKRDPCWTVARPIWVYAWPDGQHRTAPADADEHQQDQRYRALVRRFQFSGAPVPRRVRLNRHLRAAPVLLTDAQVEHALREAGKLRAEPDADAIDRVRRRLGLGGAP